MKIAPGKYQCGFCMTVVTRDPYKAKKDAEGRIMKGHGQGVLICPVCPGKRYIKQRGKYNEK